MAKMTIRECMDAAYQLLNEYSIAGEVVHLSYNDQADLENRMVNLINAAQMEIAKTVRPIDEMATFVVDDHNFRKGWETIPLPYNFDRIVSVRFLEEGDRPWREPEFYRTNRYRQLEDGTLYFPTDRKGTYVVEYQRFPIRYSADVDKNTGLDNTPDTHEAIPYYVASMLAIDDNQYAYAAFQNEWEKQLARMNNKPPHVESGMVDDAYGFNHFHGVW
jgi:hypothetical protein